MKQESDRIFSGKWITSAELASAEPIDVFHRQLDKTPVPQTEFTNKHILFRRRFTLDCAGQVILYITADDYYKLYINGTFVTQGPAPSYHFHYNYNKVDIGGYLRAGINTIAVHTYYQGLINRVWTSGDNRHGFICDMVADGKVILCSDESFKCREHTAYSALGTAGYKTQFLERYDTRSAEVNFESEDYDDSAWDFAAAKKNADYVLYEQKTARLVFSAKKPVSTQRTDSGYLFDFGSEYVGYPVFSAKGERGSTIIIRCAQELDDAGRARYQLRANCRYEEEMVLSGGVDTLNQFDYKSFRYLELILPPGCTVDEGSVTMLVRHYPFSLRQKPNTDDADLLRIWDLCVHTLRYGVQEVIQDCMEREKGFYLGDGCYTVLTYSVLTDDYAMMEKLIDDSLRTAFINKGLVTCADCSFMQEIAEYSLMLIPLVWAHYRLTGKRDYLESKYEGLRDILEFYRENYETDAGILNNLDKWCVVEWPAPYRDGYDAEITEGKLCTTAHSVINAYYVEAIKVFGKISAALGRQPYRDFEKVKKAYTDAFYDGDKHLFKDNPYSEHYSFPSNGIAFGFGLCPDAECEKNIIKMIEEKTIASSMFFVTFPVLYGLKRRGLTEMLHRQIKIPGAWLRMLSEGATTTFEGWGKDTKWNTSLFHLTLSYAALFLCDGLWDKLRLS